MNDLPNLDHVDDLDRGVEPDPEPATPSDTTTAARINWTAAGIMQAEVTNA